MTFRDKQEHFYLIGAGRKFGDAEAKKEIRTIIESISFSARPSECRLSPDVFRDFDDPPQLGQLVVHRQVVAVDGR